MKHLSKVLAIVLSVCLLLALTPAVLADDDPIASGTFDGYTTTWAVMPDGRLIIGGTGDMPDWQYSWPEEQSHIDNRPYDTYRAQLTKLIVEEGVTSIGECAFYGYFSFEEIYLPSTLTSSGWCAFQGPINHNQSVYCPDMETWCHINWEGDLSNPVEGAYLYIGGSLLTNLELPNDLTEVKAYTFYGCRGLTGDLVIPDSVLSIGWRAFDYTGFDGTLTIGNSVETIGGHAFESCQYLTGNLLIPNSVISINSEAFFGCSNLTGDLVIPDSVTSIGEYAFSDCRGFDGNLIIGNSVETIGENAFRNCINLTGKLSIPGSAVNHVDKCAFHGCAAATDIFTFFEYYSQYIYVEDTPAFEVTPTPTEQGYKAYPVCCSDCRYDISGCYYHEPIDYVPISSIYQYPTEFFMIPASTQQIRASVDPWNATNQTLAYSSDNMSVATVDENGLVTAYAPGTATITITPADGGSEAYATVTVTVTCPHSSLNAAVKENEVPATATSGGSYDLVVYCATCGDEVVRINVTTEPTGSSGAHTHTAGEASIENEDPATCTSGGSYDVVFYCTDCGDQIARTTVYTTPLQHNLNPAVKENEVPASVTAGGSYDLVIYCADCGNEVSRTTVYTDPISTEGHVPGEAVRENEVPATCSAGGSYDLVYYCTDCGIEITRTTVYTEPTQHVYGEQVIDREPTATEPGLAHRACIHCGDVIEFEIPAGTTGGGTDVVESGKIVSSGSFIERILAFFRKIIEFFANLSI